MSKPTRNKLFCRIQPCKNCPYRKDASLQLWDKIEFIKVLEAEKQLFSPVFQCHKKDGHICVGYLMDQDKRRIPNIYLRILLSKHNITLEYLDKLHSKTPLYKDIFEMIQANYPELLQDDKDKPNPTDEKYRHFSMPGDHNNRPD